MRQRQELDRLLDRVVAGGETEATGDLAPFLHPARAARASLTRFPSPETVEVHLAMLRRDRSREVVVLPSVATRKLGRRLAVGFLAAAVVLVLGGSSAVATSDGAIPGDATYGLKRSVERISLALHRDPVGRAAAHLRIVERRMSEVEKLRGLGRDLGRAQRDYAEAVSAAEQDVLAAQARGLDGDAELDQVMDMLSKHVARLAELAESGQLPDQAQDAIQRAIRNAQKAQDNVQQGRDNQPHDRPTPPGHGGEPPGRK